MRVLIESYNKTNIIVGACRHQTKLFLITSKIIMLLIVKIIFAIVSIIIKIIIKIIMY